MAKVAQPIEIPSGATSQGPARTSIWASIHPRLLELIRAHRSTLLFVNSRRLSERLASALNELAGESLVRSHHGSIARPQRLEIEDALKAGRLRALVATSSLELGIDMGAIDLVIQIEAPPSVASGMQRIGRASHQVGGVSSGVIFPKFRGDLVACAAVTARCTRAPSSRRAIRATRSTCWRSRSSRWWRSSRGRPTGCLPTIRQAAPFAELSPRAFEGVLDMLSGRYPSDEFAELRPRVTWDRVGQTLSPREGALRVAVANAGTIPDRGLYGVFLVGARPGTGRVGELDEEMVFESRVGETFLLGASTWRIEEITHDRVLVSPAPGEPGQDAVLEGRPGRAAPRAGLCHRPAGARARARCRRRRAIDRLMRAHDLDRVAAENLLQYLADQVAATGAVPDDRTIVVERCRDELGDWRVCVLSPLGGKVLIPWCLAVVARFRLELGLDVETMWSDDGFVVRVPDMDEPPASDLFVPSPDDGRVAGVAAAGRRARCSRRSFARSPAVRCCCRAIGPAGARRCGSSASARRICWRSPRASGLSPRCSRPSASACATSSTCPRWWTRCSASRGATSAWSAWTRRCRRRLPPRCCSATSRRFCTTATRRWPNGARRR